MPTAISFSTFVSLLPKSAKYALAQSVDGVSYIDEENSRFVEPTLAKAESVSDPSVILLSAPGAVGKSTVAAELARRTNSTPWDLSKFQVGSNSFAGTLTKSFGTAAGGVMENLNSGDFLVVLDAIDEAAVRAGAQNLDAFLDDLVGHLKNERPKPVVVLLGRSDTIDWVSLYFDDRGVPLARYELEFFDEAAAQDFIDRRLDYKRQQDRASAVHRSQRKIFLEARTELFQLASGLLSVKGEDPWRQPNVRRFLGYAPVLVALADYLDNPNCLALKNDIHRTREAFSHYKDMGQWAFLVAIILELLKREQQKMVDAVRPRMTAAAQKINWGKWSDLYSPEEQCRRILGATLKVPVEETLPDELARTYAEALETQLPQHPFHGSMQGFANVVFQEYVYAWALVNGAKQFAPALRSALYRTLYRPSPLLARFILTLTGEAKDSTISGEDLGLFYESMQAGEARRGDLSLSVYGNSNEAECVFSLKGVEEVVLGVNNIAGGLRFWTRLSYADIAVDGIVQLGVDRRVFALGPKVDLTCGQLAIVSEQVQVDFEEDVRLAADEYLQNAQDVKLTLRNEGKGKLRVFWPDIGHPWVRYRTPEVRRAAPLNWSERAQTLAKMVMMFRRQRTRQTRTVHQARLSPSEQPIRSQFIELALKHGVLTKVNLRDAYEFSSEYDSLKGLIAEPMTITPKARAFLDAFLGREESARVVGIAESAST